MRVSIEADLAQQETRTFVDVQTQAVARFNHAITSIQWDEIAFKNRARSHLIRLPEPAVDARLAELNELISQETEFRDFFRELARISRDGT